MENQRVGNWSRSNSQVETRREVENVSIRDIKIKPVSIAMPTSKQLNLII